jgi:hypothetical protein
MLFESSDKKPFESNLFSYSQTYLIFLKKNSSNQKIPMKSNYPKKR